MLGRHGLETYVTPSESWDCSQRKKGEIIEARKLCNEMDDGRDAELSLTEQSVVPFSYSLAQSMLSSLWFTAYVMLGY